MFKNCNCFISEHVLYEESVKLYKNKLTFQHEVHNFLLFFIRRKVSQTLKYGVFKDETAAAGRPRSSQTTRKII